MADEGLYNILMNIELNSNKPFNVYYNFDMNL